jgi:hypothetical protein
MRVPVVDPAGPSLDPTQIESFAETEQGLRDDFEWIAGYRRGREDASRVKRQETVEGPGAPSGHWDPTLARLDGYQVGLADAGSA